jgi:hypothetical protein
MPFALASLPYSIYKHVLRDWPSSHHRAGGWRLKSKYSEESGEGKGKERPQKSDCVWSTLLGLAKEVSGQACAWSASP